MGIRAGLEFTGNMYIYTHILPFKANLEVRSHIASISNFCNLLSAVNSFKKPCENGEILSGWGQKK